MNRLYLLSSLPSRAIYQLLDDISKGMSLYEWHFHASGHFDFAIDLSVCSRADELSRCAHFVFDTLSQYAQSILCMYANDK